MKVLQLDKNLNVSKSEWIIIVKFSKKFIIHIVTVFGRCVHKERGNDVKKGMAGHFKTQIFYYCYYCIGACTSNLQLYFLGVDVGPLW